jgi:hypothetical protein
MQGCIMTSYATCAYIGCTKQIPYGPSKDWSRPRYCEHHEDAMKTRIGPDTPWDALNIRIVKTRKDRCEKLNC